MANLIVQVWFSPDCELQTRGGGFQVIQTDFESFDAFCNAVADDRLIVGEMFFTRRGELHQQIVTGRQMTAFRGGAVRRCSVPRWHYVDEAELID